MHRLLQASWSESRTRVQKDGLSALCEYLRLWIVEAVERAGRETEREGGARIEARHLQNVLAQLLLDF